VKPDVEPDERSDIVKPGTLVHLVHSGLKLRDLFRGDALGRFLDGEPFQNGPRCVDLLRHLGSPPGDEGLGGINDQDAFADQLADRFAHRAPASLQHAYGTIAGVTATQA